MHEYDLHKVFFKKLGVQVLWRGHNGHIVKNVFDLRKYLLPKQEVIKGMRGYNVQEIKLYLNFKIHDSQVRNSSPWVGKILPHNENI